MRAAVIAAALSLPLLLTACGGSQPPRHHPAEPAAVKAMTVNQVELLCQDMGAAAEHGTGWTYSRVVRAAVSFAPQMNTAQARAAVAWVVRHGCPQYAHLLPRGAR